ncbi:hypothetical protein FWJ25_05460 [Marinobacter salinexigens]|uniref:Uncharacterized protein n=1 Tax=Marinobacter salinexigens TaxID=2919747 RepID=A0A5B0VLF8_9GAMM|nr:hypothetical protein [Marinobacter salinexigens]KAA1174829.1 hypothetical protein FWJ25_05460 [Marinobacter salinexigens]
MAENQATAEETLQSAGHNAGVVLRPGRAADPVPAETALPEASVPQGTGAPELADVTNEKEGERENVNSDQILARSRQRKLRLILRQCDRVLLMDFDLLAMNDWPDSYSLAAARKSRDLWLFSALIAAAVFLSGLTGFVPAWIAGTGFGAFVIILLLGLPVIRRIYTSKPSYIDLVVKRQRMLRDARKHVAHLEGDDGLIWQCARMAEFNPALSNTRFSDLLRLSEHRVVARNLTRREHVRLYLIYLLEAEKAYGRAQTAFFEGNQEALDKGWQEAVAQPEVRA